MKWMLFSLISITLAACSSAPPVDQLSQEQLQNNMQVKTSDFDADVTIEGTVIGNTVSRGLTLDIENYSIKTLVNKKTGVISHHVVIKIDYNMDWRYYDSISFKGGDSRQVNVIQRDVKACSGNMFSGCSFTETVSTSFTTEEVRQAMKNEGLLFRLNSRYNNIFTVVHFPPNYLEAQLKASKRIADSLTEDGFDQKNL